MGFAAAPSTSKDLRSRSLGKKLDQLPRQLGRYPMVFLVMSRVYHGLIHLQLGKYGNISYIVSSISSEDIWSSHSCWKSADLFGTPLSGFFSWSKGLINLISGPRKEEENHSIVYSIVYRQNILFYSIYSLWYMNIDPGRLIGVGRRVSIQNGWFSGHTWRIMPLKNHSDKPLPSPGQRKTPPFNGSTGFL